MHNLNENQQKAIKVPPEQPLLIVAGAGTGKTKTLTSRLAHFLASGVPGDQILAITFTNKAAKEMAERVKELSGYGVSGIGSKPETRNPKTRPFIGTFHSFGASLLRKNAPLVGRSHDFVIFDDHDSFSLLKKVLKGMEKKKASPGLLREEISSIKNGAPLEDAPPEVQEVFRHYEEALRRNDAFDFDDLLSKTVSMLETHPQVLRRYQERFTHILVDEYQDLNDMQYALIRLLAGGGASLSVVGDAEQTIYGWRGSNIKIFLSFPEHWKDPAMITLTQNYRSTKHILGAAAGVIKENVYDTKVQRATDLWTENTEGERVVVHEAADEEDEAFWIAEKIAASASGEREQKNKTLAAPARSSELESIAVLYRTNAQSRAIEQALLRKRISYRVFGGLKFYERKEIKDIVAGIRLAMNPEDEVSRDRIEKQFSKRLFRELTAAFDGIKDRRPLTLIGAFLKTADYLLYIKTHLTNPYERQENIEELLRFAAGYESLSAFLEEIALLQSTDEIAASASGERERQNPTLAAHARSSELVTLTTVHLAKGLEFDRVFIAGVNEGLLPHTRSMGSKDELQEERRLMYVAMTRARKELFISFYDIPSRFIGEIPEEHARFESASIDAGTTRGWKDEFSSDFEDYEEKYISLD